jgi:RecA-family ATPase
MSGPDDDFLSRAEEAARAEAYHRRRRANGQAAGEMPFELIDPSTLEGGPAVPARRWLVPDWVPMDRVTALYGGGGEGKTRLAQMLATASAIDGGQWIGLSVRRCNSLLLFCEDDQDEMHRRQDEINNYFSCSYADLSPMRWLPRLGHDNALMAFEGRPLCTDFFGEVIAAAKAHDAELVIVDTLADVFPGNENDRGQARAFAQQALGYLAREIKGAVIALAHPSRAGINSGSGESGSTAWIGTFRSQLYLSTPKAEDGASEDPDVRLLTRKKSNSARRDDTIELRWRDGVFVPKTMPTGIIASIERRTCERVFLDLLDRVAAEGRHVSESPYGTNYAPKLFAARPDREGFRKADFERAMQALFASKQIAIGKYKGASRHEHDCIVRSAALGCE